MSDLSERFPEIRSDIAAKHNAYLKKFGPALSIVAGELELSRTRILAKMKLMSQIFLDNKIIDEAIEMVVSSKDGTYPMSMKIGKRGNPMCLYLLNNGMDIIISDSIGLAITDHTMDTRIILVTDQRHVFYKFYNVLNDDFSWDDMANIMLNSIHRTIYDRLDVALKDLMIKLGAPNP